MKIPAPGLPLKGMAMREWIGMAVRETIKLNFDQAMLFPANYEPGSLQQLAGELAEPSFHAEIRRFTH